jgi:hypothetical protein
LVQLSIVKHDRSVDESQALLGTPADRTGKDNMLSTGDPEFERILSIVGPDGDTVLYDGGTAI